MALRWKFWKKEETPPKKIKMVDGHVLTIITNNGRDILTLSNPELKPLWKIYQWYLTKDSERYNVVWSEGMMVVHRHEITNMTIKHQKIKDIWSKDDD